MPLTLTKIDYNKTVMYLIEQTNNPALFYTGHTTNFVNRKHAHKMKHAKETNEMMQSHGFENFRIDPIKMIKCSNGLEAKVAAEQERIKYSQRVV